MDSPKLTVTKLDAARRQLGVAIRLWFADDDPVAIHTLAAAAHEIVHTLFRLRGFHGLMFDSKLVKNEYRSDWAKLIKRPASFFKHAQRDPDSEFEFDPRANWALLLAAAHGVSRMGYEPRMEELALAYWFRIHQPDWFPETPSGNGAPVDPFEKVRTVKKGEFLEGFEFCWRRGDFSASSVK
jgi:hypothetical protein